jgi:DNA repair photolyase
VNFTITTLDEKLARLLEPRATRGRCGSTAHRCS